MTQVHPSEKSSLPRPFARKGRAGGRPAAARQPFCSQRGEPAASPPKEGFPSVAYTHYAAVAIALRRFSGAPASRRVAQSGRERSASSCLSAQREFELAARPDEQRREARKTGERGVFLLGYLFLDKQEKLTSMPGYPRHLNTASQVSPHATG
jgi:hypothetical protein